MGEPLAGGLALGGDDLAVVVTLRMGIVIAGGNRAGLVAGLQHEVLTTVLLGDFDRFVAGIPRREEVDDLIVAGDLVARAPARRRHGVGLAQRRGRVDDALVALTHHLGNRLEQAVASLVGRWPLQPALPSGTAPLGGRHRIELPERECGGRHRETRTGGRRRRDRALLAGLLGRQIVAHRSGEEVVRIDARRVVFVIALVLEALGREHWVRWILALGSGIASDCLGLGSRSSSTVTGSVSGGSPSQHSAHSELS
ncbi:hypothetical protein ACFQL0_21550 [Haloplanus litoreus]|uniref:hypothetical protein n=1 Tax=Haloplanus litoreus TaxID=767515 RepID=UPI00360FABCC